ncbi:cytochrome b-c1 complex subunit 7-like [Planococcus citri]|uniref:cytochrome b-c1 complex subunit 7-like n=1 Tax=Planococcus citri TaxID=170843 RepID=UPI0031F7D63F
MSNRRLTNLLFYYKPNLPIKIVPEKMSMVDYFKKWHFLRSEYYKLGLYHDDILYCFPDVDEAVRRLPKAVKEERDWRSIRAIQLDLNHKILPQEEWIQWEDDITVGRYLQPYLAEVKKEWKEKDIWNSIY